ncbi:MAG: helix-turn-helix domain-containing protein [Candidatus Sulfotelmatobacter sp.]
MKTRTLEVRHLLTANQTATLLNCHTETLYTWVKEGRIGCIRTGRNRSSTRRISKNILSGRAEGEG